MHRALNAWLNTVLEVAPPAIVGVAGLVALVRPSMEPLHVGFAIGFALTLPLMAVIHELV